MVGSIPMLAGAMAIGRMSSILIAIFVNCIVYWLHAPKNYHGFKNLGSASRLVTAPDLKSDELRPCRFDPCRFRLHIIDRSRQRKPFGESLIQVKTTSCNHGDNFRGVGSNDVCLSR